MIQLTHSVICLFYLPDDALVTHAKNVRRVSFLLSFTLNRKSGRKGSPSFSQTTFGVGAPVKRHFSFSPLPSVTTTRPRSLGSTTETFGLVAEKRINQSN